MGCVSEVPVGRGKGLPQAPEHPHGAASLLWIVPGSQDLCIHGPHPLPSQTLLYLKPAITLEKGKDLYFNPFHPHLATLVSERKRKVESSKEQENSRKSRD